MVMRARKAGGGATAAAAAGLERWAFHGQDARHGVERGLGAIGPVAFVLRQREMISRVLSAVGRINGAERGTKIQKNENGRGGRRLVTMV